MQTKLELPICSENIEASYVLPKSTYVRINVTRSFCLPQTMFNATNVFIPSTLNTMTSNNSGC